MSEVIICVYTMNISAQLNSNFFRIARQLNYTREFVTPNMIKLHIPGGIPYEAYDETGSKVTPWNIMQIIESARAFSFYPMQTDSNSTKSYIDSNDLLSENFYFIARTNLKVNREFYEISSPKYPLLVTKVLDFVGKSSMNITSTIQHPESANPYVICKVQTVLVSPETRKPTPFPEWWRQKYEKNATELGGSPLIMQPLTQPESAHADEMTRSVYPRDTDTYKHTNWTTYIRYCTDAYSMLVAKNSFKNINERSLENGVEELTISFRQESVLGDILNVEAWEDNQMKNILNFQVKKGGTICSEATIKFFDDIDDAY